jgi:hypothetical protein
MMAWRRMISGLALLSAGCTGSRWARDDVDYAHKYAEHTDDSVRTVKQAVDARHVIGKRGMYAGFAGRDEPFGAGAEAGVFAYPRSWLETRIGGALLAHEGERPLSGGGLVGVRVQPPTRLAPFVGLGGYLGWAGFEDRSLDNVDNDNDGFVDEPDEESDFAFVGAIAPEAGVHYWLTSRLRLTGGADYRLTTDGRGADALFYGVSLAWLEPGQRSPSRRTADHAENWDFAADERPELTASAPRAEDAVTTSAAVSTPPDEDVRWLTEEVVTSIESDLQ